MQFDVQGPDELAAVSRFMVAECQDVPTWVFRGEMGAGKTTLIKQICEDLDVIDIVNSPTFSIVNEYLTEEDRPIYHFDFYRIKDEQEAFDVGTGEYLESGDLCLLEWAEKIPGLLPEHYIEISITLVDSLQRKIMVKRHG